jgi:hypothetical protein
MGFLRKQEEKMAVRLLAWQYQRMNMHPPSAAQMEAHAKQIVDDAHRIARERGKNVLSILKELVAEVKKR